MGVGVGDLCRCARAWLVANSRLLARRGLGKHTCGCGGLQSQRRSVRNGDVAKNDEPFKAKYQLLDSHTQFRPQRTARKPQMRGPQTALVVGPPGEEIWTDKFGRVMVQFDWTGWRAQRKVVVLDPRGAIVGRAEWGMQFFRASARSGRGFSRRRS